MKKQLISSMTLVFALLVSNEVFAGFDEGKAAFMARDFATALKEFEPLAKSGDKQAQHILGMMYDEGQGVKQDYAKAAEWYKKAGNQGNQDSQYNLGVMYAQAQGVAKDDNESFKWFEKAAKQGHILSQFALGRLYT
ncbi:MAG: sel1 repeat family protein, partial [Methylotenera sp.]|nr:sel1 repeat family protein [Methylotenera sp.]